MAKVEYKYPNNAVNIVKEYVANCNKAQMELPTVEGIALLLGVNDDTVVEWGKKHEDFGEEIKRLKLTQKVQLINNGAYGGKEVNAAMFIFLLKANFGMKDRLDVTTNDKDMPQPILGGKALDSV